ncbi:CC0125/CC1285 family lipoprotein [Solimonas marina]|uniref:Lipoprotein n=1 Tax=Solimonas marina TaxID=2714601 RepID=A0A969W9X8_9GAMM|nr:hypothetical protein [Solimonas marina]NKF23357.1 hypothetical protein [Solimonas marina]
MFRRLLLIACVSTISACATAPARYAPAAQAGDIGYRETVLGAAQYRVTYTGDTATPAATVRNYALLRAADLTLEQGADWFEVTHQDTERKGETRTRIDPGFVTPPRQTVYRSCGLLACSTSVVYSPGYVEGGSAQTQTDYAYSSALDITLHHGRKPADDINAYDAHDVAQSLRPTVSAR